MLGLHWMRWLVVGIGAGWGERERESVCVCVCGGGGGGSLGSSVTLIGEERGRG